MHTDILSIRGARIFLSPRNYPRTIDLHMTLINHVGGWGGGGALAILHTVYAEILELHMSLLID